MEELVRRVQAAWPLAQEHELEVVSGTEVDSDDDSHDDEDMTAKGGFTAGDGDGSDTAKGSFTAGDGSDTAAEGSFMAGDGSDAAEGSFAAAGDSSDAAVEGSFAAAGSSSDKRPASCAAADEGRPRKHQRT